MFVILPIKRIADGLTDSGYKVSADVPGYSRPGAINGKYPDIVATKGGAKKIIEVETADSYVKDRDQRKVFRDYADRHENVSFRTVKI